MRIMHKNTILVIAVITSLTIGAGGAYAITYNQAVTLTNEKAELLTQLATWSSEKTQLQNQVNSLTEDKKTLQNLTSTLKTEKINLQSQVSSLTSENAALEDRYHLMVEVLDEMHSSNWTRIDSYNIAVGTQESMSFILDRYSLLWETVVDFPGNSMSMTYYYWYKGMRYYVTTFSRSLSTVDEGPHDYLYGEIQLDLAIDYRNPNRIYLSYYTSTQFPEVSTSGNMFIDIS